MTTTQMIQVSKRDLWFEKAERHQIKPGATLAEILDLCGVPIDLQPFYEVAINGHTVPSERRPRVRPKVGTPDKPVVVTIHPPHLHGGNRGTAKNVITVVATIALIASTAWIGAGGLGLALGVTALQGGVGAAMAASPFGLPGRVAVTL